ncbi:hypothetical protein DFJ58DRAFT_737096 [Suillus subalutaceus]|uniref:uncharacterized protein n=1 Tax=Suillus subalutaceus TaxID=48586 RepID=UPI001B875214|nr:uncharacterized protein DFJ58DRAFT_737096 [Suillus subalutaceus]KAG1830073.1 hypothetical protein DFJ58DRAFT_737096 [Suillus subalutaceus]
MSELDVDVPEIEFAAWPDECIKQLNDEVPEMFDIPLGLSLKIYWQLMKHIRMPPDLAIKPTSPYQFHSSTSREDTHLPQVPNVFDRESRPVLPTSRDEPVGGGRRQASLPFKAKKPLRVDPTFMRRMEESPADSRNDADLELAPYPGPRREDRDFVAPNRRREYSRSPPVYPQRDPSRSRYYRPTYRQRETSPVALSDDVLILDVLLTHAGKIMLMISIRGSKRRAGDSHYEDGPSRFRY